MDINFLDCFRRKKQDLAFWDCFRRENQIKIFINQVFPRKTLVIKMMNIHGRAGWSDGLVGRAGNSNSFLEDNSATVRNILMIPGRIIDNSVQSVTYKNDNYAYLHFLIMSPNPYFDFIFVSGA